jgi:hypothetical protein
MKRSLEVSSCENIQILSRIHRQRRRMPMRPTNISRIASFVVILIVGGLLYIAEADDDGVYCYNYQRVTNTEAVAKNDVRLNVRTPVGYYVGYGNCLVWIDAESLEDRGPIWVRVYVSGKDGRYTVRERSARMSGSGIATKGAKASGSI